MVLTQKDKVEILDKINNVKTDMIKWLVGLFIALVLMIIGLYFK